MKKVLNISMILTALAIMVNACTKEKDEEVACPPDPGDSLIYDPTYVNLNDRLPSYFIISIQEPEDNPTTVEGIDYGRKLFYEPLLSGDGTQSCAQCHQQPFSFTDENQRFSIGIDGIEGKLNTMQIVNMGLHKKFFWNGRANSLEEQAFQPVTNPIEMHDTWENVENKLNAIPDYQVMNFKAFGTYVIDSFSVVKAIAQFERSMISSNSKFDRFQQDPVGNPLTALELQGYNLFISEKNYDDQGNATTRGADCWHCHAPEKDMFDNTFRNNALDVIPDSGLASVTKNPDDFGKFKVPSLRNIAETWPYMHDARFPNLDSVINFYSEGLAPTDHADPDMKHVDRGGVRLDSIEKVALKAFLKTLTDEDYYSNPNYSNPNISARWQP